jgi:prophage regulatory protein
MDRQSFSSSELSRPQRLIRLPEVKFRTGLSRSTIYRRISEGTFPKPRRIGGAIVAWTECEIDGWVAKFSDVKSG